MLRTELAVSVIDLVPEIPDNLLESAAEGDDFDKSFKLDWEYLEGERPRSTGVLAYSLLVLEEEADLLIGVPFEVVRFVAGEGVAAEFCLIFCRGETPSPGL